MSTDVSPVSCPTCGGHDVVVFRQPSSKFSGGGAVPSMRCRACGFRASGSACPPEARALLEGGLPAQRPVPYVTWRPAPQPVRRAPAVPRVQAPVEPEGPCCAWRECSEPARDGSKYCSRECSNKNARARYAKRKAEDERSAA
ncbi:MAG: hypothetical protein H6732_05990 [Alphaproteobacteria bacterium]|nr:hypothetical protein [Alphaproteobacteria bacterium]